MSDRDPSLILAEELEIQRLQDRPRRRPRRAARVKSLIVYRHDTGQEETHRWSLPRLLLMLQHYRPRPGKRDPDRSFVVGPRDAWLMIGTAGPRWFEGQHPVHDDRGRFAGVMLYDRLSAQAAERILKRFYSGWPAVRCFRPRAGRFQPYPSSSTGGGAR